MDVDAKTNVEENLVFVRRRDVGMRMVEMYMWVCAGFLAATPFWLDVLREPVPLSKILSVQIFPVLAGVLLLFFPILFQLIFGQLPLATLRRRWQHRSQRGTSSDEISVGYASSYPDVSPTATVLETDLTTLSSDKLLV